MRWINKLSNILWFSLAVILLWHYLSPGLNNKKTNQTGVMNSFYDSISKTTGRKILKSNITFDNVCGIDEIKQDLIELVNYLKNPEKYKILGAKLPKGVLLTGPPGTGKTLLAKAVAGEANCNFITCSGSEFEEMFVGLGAKRVRELFEEGRRIKPCIIFIDEIDAVGGKRNWKDANSIRQTLNELLAQLDGFESTSGILVIGATNLLESLDTALLRPGRFDRKLVID